MSLFKNTFSLISFALIGLAFCWTGPAWAQEKSASVFIRFGDLHMNYRDRNDMTKTRAVLGPGSVIQIPTTVAKFNQDGSINLNLTIENWLEFARLQKENQGFSHFAAREWECSTYGAEPLADGTCGGITFGELYFPVKVVRASGRDVEPGSPESYGYLALDYLRTHVPPHRYETVHTPLETALSHPAESTTATTQVVSGDSSFGGETTSPLSSSSVTPVASNSDVWNCDNTLYRTPRQGFQQHSCLKNLNLKQRAELVMKDVLRINQLRPSFNLDPRFSACIAYRESHMHPNAKGGTPDWGMYQVIDATGKDALKRNNPVIPGFSQYRYNWEQYKTKMLQSTLAQADLHHSVLFEKAKTRSLTQINGGTTDVGIYQSLATRYNGKGPRARHYGSRIAGCYRAMLSVARRDGTITNGANLQSALNRALN